jgi:hypothetical protein
MNSPIPQLADLLANAEKVFVVLASSGSGGW